MRRASINGNTLGLLLFLLLSINQREVREESSDFSADQSLHK